MYTSITNTILFFKPLRKQLHQYCTPQTFYPLSWLKIIQKVQPLLNPIHLTHLRRSKERYTIQPTTVTTYCYSRCSNYFLLSGTRCQSQKLLFEKLIKYVPGNIINEIAPPPNGTIIKSIDSMLTTAIRNKYSYEIISRNATLTPLAT